MNRRIVIGGTDVTDVIRAGVDAAPPLTAEQRAQLRDILAPLRAPVRPRGGLVAAAA